MPTLQDKLAEFLAVLKKLQDEGIVAIIFNEHQLSPYVNRIRMHWADMRGIVLKTFSQAPFSFLKQTVFPSVHAESGKRAVFLRRY
jgi:hypothetical protein